MMFPDLKTDVGMIENLILIIMIERGRQLQEWMDLSGLHKHKHCVCFEHSSERSNNI